MQPRSLVWPARDGDCCLLGGLPNNRYAPTIRGGATSLQGAVVSVPAGRVPSQALKYTDPPATTPSFEGRPGLLEVPGTDRCPLARSRTPLPQKLEGRPSWLGNLRLRVRSLLVRTCPRRNLTDS